MICVENIGFWGALGKIEFVLQFHRYNKIYILIPFTKARHTAQNHLFWEFLKNKM